MVKARDFWDYLCGELDYRFFAGVACRGLSPLYKKMNSKFMHYVPAANERIALGLISGAYIAGLKGCLLMDMKFKDDISSFLKFNVGYRIPFLVIGYSELEEEKLIYDFPTTYILDGEFKDDVQRVAAKSESESVPGLIVIEGDVLS